MGALSAAELLDLRHHQLPPDHAALYDGLIARACDDLGEAEFEALRQTGAGVSRDRIADEARTIAKQLAGTVRATERRRKRGPRANPEMTDREREVLAELVGGHTNQDIADTLGVSPKTVMHHTMSVYRKLGVRGRAEAVAHAVRSGLLEN